jgi:hypothetical protein
MNIIAYPDYARNSKRSGDKIRVWLLRYEGRIIANIRDKNGKYRDAFSNQKSALEYADKIKQRLVTYQLLPIETKH